MDEEVIHVQTDLCQARRLAACLSTLGDELHHAYLTGIQKLGRRYSLSREVDICGLTYYGRSLPA